MRFFDRIIYLSGYEDYELSAMETYLETMSRKGWFLYDIKRLFQFKKAEPRELKFRIEPIPNASVFDSKEAYSRPINSLNKDSDDEPWVKCCGNQLVTIYYTTSPSPSYHEFLTDEERFHAAVKQVFRRSFPAYLLLFLILLFETILVSHVFTTPIYTIMLALILTFLLCNLIVPIVWYACGTRAIKHQLPIPVMTYRMKQCRNIFQNSLVIIAVLLFLYTVPDWRPVAYFILYFVLIMICSAILNKLRKNTDGSRTSKRVKYFLFTIIISIIYLSVVRSLLY